MKTFFLPLAAFLCSAMWVGAAEDSPSAKGSTNDTPEIAKAFASENNSQRSVGWVAAPNPPFGAIFTWHLKSPLEQRLRTLQVQLRGDQSLARREEPWPPTINERVQDIVGSQWHVTSPPTQTQRDACRFAGEAFETVLSGFRALAEKDLPALESKLESAGARWTPGRIPQWKMEKE